MEFFKKKALPVLAAAVWISLSEFLRNELLFKSYWTEHYESLGLTFPADPVNGIVWAVWAICLAVLVYLLADKFKVVPTTLISWFAGFVMMWIVVGNLGVLPYGLLIGAVPLSLLEVFIANVIIVRLK